MSRVIHEALAVVLVSALAAGCGQRSDSDSQGDTDTGDPSAEAARVEIRPAGLLVTPSHPGRLEATVLDAEGRAIDREVTWSVSGTGVAVAADGTVTATGTAGSAVVTGTVDGALATVAVVVVQAAEGVVLVDDAGFAGLPEPVDPSAPFGVGYQTRVPLVAAPPAIGSILVATGEQPVMGRVVAVEGSAAIVEQVALAEALVDLQIDLTVPLGAQVEPPIPDDASPFGGFRAGRFSCSTENETGVDVDLLVDHVEITGRESLGYRLVWQGAQKSLSIYGQPRLDFEIEPRLVLQGTSGVDCRVFLGRPQIPLPGPLGLVFGASAPLGLGFELSGDLEALQVGANLKGSVGLDYDVGFDCTNDTCTVRNHVDVAPRQLEPTVTFPAGARFAPTIAAYGWANLDVGTLRDPRLSFGLLRARGGLALSGSFAPMETQFADRLFDAEYALSVFAEFRPGAGVEQYGGLVGLAGLALAQWDADTLDLARSPTGTLAADRTSWESGDDVVFTVQLSADDLDFGPFDHNVDEVRLYLAEGDTVALLDDLDASPGQTTFEFPWTATGASDGVAVHAVVTTAAVPSIPLEIARFDPVPDCDGSRDPNRVAVITAFGVLVHVDLASGHTTELTTLSSFSGASVGVDPVNALAWWSEFVDDGVYDLRGVDLVTGAALPTETMGHYVYFGGRRADGKLVGLVPGIPVRVAAVDPASGSIEMLREIDDLVLEGFVPPIHYDPATDRLVFVGEPPDACPTDCGPGDSGMPDIPCPPCESRLFSVSASSGEVVSRPKLPDLSVPETYHKGPLVTDCGGVVYGARRESEVGTSDAIRIDASSGTVTFVGTFGETTAQSGRRALLLQGRYFAAVCDSDGCGFSGVDVRTGASLRLGGQPWPVNAEFIAALPRPE